MRNIATTKNQKMHIRVVNFENIVVWIYALFACKEAWLAFDKNEYLPWFASVTLWVARLCVPIGLLYLFYRLKIKKKEIMLLLLPVSYRMMQVFHAYQGYQGNGNLGLLTAAIFVLLPSDVKKKIFHIFYRIILSTNIVSVLLWICFFIGFQVYFHREVYYVASWNNYYYRWFIFAILEEGSFFRLCGIFNEPGVLGTLCALLFICTSKKAKLWEKIDLLLTGALTFSLAFYLLIFLYFAIYICQKRLVNMVYIIGFMALFLTLPKIDFHNEQLNAVAARLEITENGLAGDNRTSAIFDAEYEDFIHTSDVWLGKGAGFSFGGSNSSWKSHYLVPYGIVGTIFLLGMWGCAALFYAEGNKDALIFILLFFISLYQRPAPIENILGYVLIMGGIEWIKEGKVISR